MNSKWHRRAAVMALLLLAPILSELLYGATRLSFIFALVPQVGAWGCGALMIRYAARRWRLGWPGMLLLGLALAVAEECVIQQTSIAPLVGVAMAEYGRIAGVNWVYFIWALGFEAVWVVLVPVQLVDLMYPDRRDDPWLRTAGFVRAAFFFCLASFIAWFTWVKRARTEVFHMPAYDPPRLYLGLAIAAIIALVAAAYALRGPRSAMPGEAPSPMIVGLAIAVLGLPWGSLVLLAYGAAPQLPFEWVMVASLAWAALAFALMRRWSFRTGWQDAHRYAAVCGALGGSMLAGYVLFAVGGALRMDWIGKIVFNGIAAVWLFTLRRPARTSTLLARDLYRRMKR